MWNFVIFLLGVCIDDKTLYIVTCLEASGRLLCTVQPAHSHTHTPDHRLDIYTHLNIQTQCDIVAFM